tara:strand:- start:283 stop:675 length:393 start_codon:yes stop_codon:yes gene_type:complete
MNLLFFIFTFITIIFEIAGQYLFKLSYETYNNDNLFNKYIVKIIKNYFNNNKNIFIILGVLFYSITGYFVYKLLAFGHIGIINIIWHLMHFIALFLVGYFFFGETLNKKKIVALIFAIISIVLFMIDGLH